MAGKFDEMYNVSDEDLKAKKKDTVKSKLMRKLESAYDDATDKIIDENERLEKVYDDIENYDVNIVIQAKFEIEALEDTQKIIKDEFSKLFGIELKK
jgi:hypothetical protein